MKTENWKWELLYKLYVLQLSSNSMQSFNDARALLRTWFGNSIGIVRELSMADASCAA